MKNAFALASSVGAVLLFGIAFDAPAAEIEVREGDWVVEGHEIVHDRHIQLNGNLILPAGTELELNRTTLEIVGRFSRDHTVEWKGGKLTTTNSTLGGLVNDQGVAIHTVFHLYEGEWHAIDTTVQYSYGISFHWEHGRGVLRGTRLQAGPRPDAIILSGEADVKLVDSDFPIGLGVYVDKGGSTQLDLTPGKPVTATYDSSSLLPGVSWKLELVNTTVERWFVFVRNIGMHHPAAEITLNESHDLIVSLLGHNLTGTASLSNHLTEPIKIGNVTLRGADQPAGISMFAIYLSGEENDLELRGQTHLCELMHRGGTLRVIGTPGEHELSIGCTTLEVSGDARLEVEHVHLGRPLTWQSDNELGEATVAGEAQLLGSDISINNVRFRTQDAGAIRLTKTTDYGLIEEDAEGGSIQITPATTTSQP